jgi:hypothetical protein
MMGLKEVEDLSRGKHNVAVRVEEATRRSAPDSGGVRISRTKTAAGRRRSVGKATRRRDERGTKFPLRR